MRAEDLSPEDLDAIELLTERFALAREEARTLFLLARKDPILVESALLVAREMGFSPGEGARNYIIDILRLPGPDRAG